MEMKLGERLINLRKKKGMTQEQLAGKLGISASAVSKWETDSSYPDVTLLCPLARALDTNVDTLLQFEETISDAEVIEKLNTVLETAFADGWETAEAKVLELLHQYPNSVCLKFNVSVVMDSFRMFFPDAEEAVKTRWTERKRKLLLDIYELGDTAYRKNAALGLASMAVADDKIEKAEKYLAEFPEQENHPIPDLTFTKASLALKKEEPEEALKIVQKRLYSLVSQVQICLSFMTNPKLIGEHERILQILDAYRQVDETFGLGKMYDGMYLGEYLRTGQYEQAADALARYADVITGEMRLPKEMIFAPGLQPGRRETAMTKEMRNLLVKSLEDEQYAPLWEYPQSREALKKIKSCGETVGS